MRARQPNWTEWIENPDESKAGFNYYLRKNLITLSEDRSARHLKKTNHNLRLASWLFSKQQTELQPLFHETFYDWVISVYYYAIYHAALALVSSQGYKTKTHSATICFLIANNYHANKNLNKQDINLVAHSLSKEDIEIIGDIKDLRERASYDADAVFEGKLAERVSKNASDFITKIKLLLNK